MRIKSDYRPLLVDLCPEFSTATGQLFRFLAGWIHHQDFSNTISNLWDYHGDMTSTPGKLSIGLKEWNKKTYGHIGTQKRETTQKLNKIQYALEKTNSTFLIQKEMELREELEEILKHEKLLWKQKSRLDWLKLGDRNTKFFYERTLYR
ncbi:hypothetical protein J1N35_043594 [Gossypium stocksii]|uniref:Uncharacterized protein n=1 Tax=Gossypium stocksii TaxID=47602 RepID=A0A9D3U7I9_9ROSI|nr:hypothetical protein J1N35_043594 [Gossypium stocksii]